MRVMYGHSLWTANRALTISSYPWCWKSDARVSKAWSPSRSVPVQIKEQLDSMVPYCSTNRAPLLSRSLSLSDRLLPLDVLSLPLRRANRDGPFSFFRTPAICLRCVYSIGIVEEVRVGGCDTSRAVCLFVLNHTSSFFPARASKAFYSLVCLCATD